MDMNTGITFKVYLLAKGDKRKEEGFLLLWKHKGGLVKSEKPIPFDALNELPAKIAAALKRSKINWPA
jgi:hypothetical protein